jgi:cell division protein FtsL
VVPIQTQYILVAELELLDKVMLVPQQVVLMVAVVVVLMLHQATQLVELEEAFLLLEQQ